MTSNPPSPSAADPVLRRAQPHSLRWWVVLALITTVLAAAAIVATAVATREPAYTPITVPTGDPTP